MYRSKKYTKSYLLYGKTIITDSGNNWASVNVRITVVQLMCCLCRTIYIFPGRCLNLQCVIITLRYVLANQQSRNLNIPDTHLFFSDESLHENRSPHGMTRQLVRCVTMLHRSHVKSLYLKSKLSSTHIQIWYLLFLFLYICIYWLMLLKTPCGVHTAAPVVPAWMSLRGRWVKFVMSLATVCV